MAETEAGASRRGRRRSRSAKKKKPNKKAMNLLHNLGWIALAAAIGLPALALALHVMH